ncbi:hypothetical protein DT076_05080 [Desertihabitans brevis]|uniref:Glycoside hydrolase family 5 domain-containing protein n=1 Tax=Desertihabitans brevis TaxID=2268447 RepID=A0A367Z0N6_9ACTN|nr:hypothetical protein [Desertihabitans brevis]RCK70771.1 hypothetical protein DT076_05080 [Desertihabitans brevis]
MAFDASRVFGFNYDGSWGTSGLDLWMHHDHGLMAKEVARGKRYFPAWNTARWWLSHEAYQRDPERFAANFEAGLGVFAAHGIGVVPVLFNRWRDPWCDFGGVPLDHILPGASSWSRSDSLFAAVDVATTQVEQLFGAYLAGVVGPHADDERVVAWDLCNEPLMGTYVEDDDSPVLAAELRWLGWVADSCRHLGASQPLTIGNFASLTAIRRTEPLVDVISFHPYYMWNGHPTQPHMATVEGFEAFLDEAVAIASEAGKPLLANETVWGARDDATHVEVMRVTLGALRARGIGFTVHALQHSLVADLHEDVYGPVSHAEWLHFVRADGSLRAGHEAFNEYAPG